MAISTKPSASSPRLGFINAQTSGRFFHAFLRLSLLADDLDAVSVAMIRGTDTSVEIGCRHCRNNYMAKRIRK